MKEFTCVTSMTQKMYDHIGSVMISSWYEYFPLPHKLIVLTEGFTLDSNDRVIYKTWEDYCLNDWKIFASRCTDKSSQRFAKKGFSFLNCLENPETRYIVWVDADIIFHKPFDQQKLENILPENKLIALFDCFYQEIANYTQEQYYDTVSRKQMGAESGFVVIDTHHKNFKEYVKRYRNLFMAESRPEECRYWYDGEIAIESARYFLDQVFDLSQLRTTSKTQTPLNRSWLAEYFTHQKGRSKESYTIDQLKGFANLK
jgi:hypothetical protein